MADTTLKIAAQFDIQGLENSLTMFQKSMEGLNLSPALLGDVNLIKTQLTKAITNAKEMMAKGIFDPEALGLKEIEYHLGILFKSVGSKTEKLFNDTIRKFDEDLVNINSKIEAEEKKLKDTEKALTIVDDPSELAKQSRKETGTSVRATKGQNLESVTKELERLKEAGLETSDAFKFYDNLKGKFENVAQAAKKLADEKEKSEKKIENLSKKAISIENKKAKAIADGTNAATKAQLNLIPVQDLINTLRKQGYKVSKDISKAEADFAKNSKKSAKATGEGANTLAKKATAAISYYVVFNQLKRVLQDTVRTIFTLDKSMTEAAIVTSMNREEVWKLLGSYQNLARSTGLATSEIAGVVTQFLRQGRSIGDAMKLAEIAAKSAKVASISADDAVNFLTSAVNGFGLAAEQSEEIADKFAAVAARSATSFQELALAMSKVSPTAKSVGVSVDFMMGVIAKGIETTREAPENIGTAFKTIFARMREVTDIGKATEDGMDLNRVEKALASVGVPLRDVSGQFRNLETVLLDVGEKWETLTSVEQAYLATALAGSRQQPRLLAIFNDFARTKELIQISAEATGELANQHYEYMQGSEAALTNLRTSWEQLTMAFVDTSLIINSLQAFAAILQVVADTMSNGLGMFIFWTAALAALGTALGALIRVTLFTTAVKIANLVVTKAEVAANEDLAQTLSTTNKSFKKLTLAQQTKILTDLAATISQKGLKAAMMGGVKAIGVQIKAMWGLIAAFVKLAIVAWPITLALLALAGIIGIIAVLVIKAGENTEFFAKKVQKINKELSELGSKERDIKKLTDRFKELDKQVAKTGQDLDEMNSIADELSEVEFDGEVFQITERDITGKITIKDDEYERFMEAVSDRREALLLANMGTFQVAISKDIEETLNNPTLMRVFESIGYDFASTFIDGLGKGLDEDVSDRLKKAAKNISDSFSPEQFMTDGSFYISSAKFDTGGQYAYDEAGNFLRFATEQAAEDYVNALYEAGKIGSIAASNLIYDIKKSTKDIVDFDAYQNFINSMMGIVNTTFIDLNRTVDGISKQFTEGALRTASIFQASANAYAAAEAQIRTTVTNPALLTQSIQFLGQTMYDEKILDNLINERKISAVVIAKMSVDLDMKSIEKLFDQLTAKTSQITTESLFSDLFSNTGAGVEKGFQTFKNLMDGLVSQAKMTREEANKMILDISNSIKTLSTKEVADMLKDQMDMSKKIFDLPNQIAKGDFSQFAELSETFGLSITKGIMSGNTLSLQKFFEAQSAKGISQIDESIEKIKGTAAALGRLPNRIEREQIAALEIIKERYADLIIQDGMRVFKLTQAKDLLKQMNDLLSLQQKLSDLGIESDTLKIFDGMADNYFNDGFDTIMNQLDKDIDNLKEFQEGGFLKPDDLGRSEAAVKKVMETLTEAVDVATAAYNRQKKAIEDRFKGEIDAIKEGHNERWSVIDYTNKLAEAEDRVAEARRRLMGFAISGVSRGTLEQAQKDLRKLQEERQKIIEQQGIDKAQKELEQEMNDDLIKAQKSFTDEISKAVDELGKYQGVLLRIIAPRVPTDKEEDQDNLDIFDGTGGSNYTFVAITEQSIDIQNKLLDSNVKLKTSLDEVRDAILTYPTRLTSSTSGDSTNSTDSTGVPRQ